MVKTNKTDGTFTGMGQATCRLTALVYTLPQTGYHTRQKGWFTKSQQHLARISIQYNIDIYTTHPQGGWYIRLILHSFRGRGALLYLKTTDLGRVAWFHHFADAADVLFGWSFGAHFFLE